MFSESSSRSPSESKEKIWHNLRRFSASEERNKIRMMELLKAKEDKSTRVAKKQTVNLTICFCPLMESAHGCTYAYFSQKKKEKKDKSGCMDFCEASKRRTYPIDLLSFVSGPSKVSTVERTPGSMSCIYHKLFNIKDHRCTEPYGDLAETIICLVARDLGSTRCFGVASMKEKRLDKSSKGVRFLLWCSMRTFAITLVMCLIEDEDFVKRLRSTYTLVLVFIVTRPTIDQDTHFELKGQFLKELRDNTFNGSKHEDANEHIEKVLEIVDVFHIPKITQDQIMLRAFLVSLTGAASRWLRNQPSGSITTWEGAIPSKTAVDAKIAIQEMAEYSHKWHNGTSSRTRSTETSDGLAAIQAQLNNLGQEIKKVNEKVYATQVGCELCKGPHYTKECPQKEEGKTLEEACYTQFGAPYQPGGQYRAAGRGFYQRKNGNSSYPDRRPSLEESLAKFMAESAKGHEENSNIIKEI
ncbi:retrotransposon protein [Tanacetum coccineum]